MEVLLPSKERILVRVRVPVHAMRSNPGLELNEFPEEEEEFLRKIAKQCKDPADYVHYSGDLLEPQRHRKLIVAIFKILGIILVVQFLVVLMIIL